KRKNFFLFFIDKPTGNGISYLHQYHKLLIEFVMAPVAGVCIGSKGRPHRQNGSVGQWGMGIIYV
ncbi:MAG: hypothetical protein LBR00_04920, partial [Clostridiales Family XIII bacterium]|nr:hypothetical protein [Clostridiales Family XIII bacterium]